MLRFLTIGSDRGELSRRQTSADLAQHFFSVARCRVTGVFVSRSCEEIADAVG
jgi:hypothetical protein